MKCTVLSCLLSVPVILGCGGAQKNGFSSVGMSPLETTGQQHQPLRVDPAPATKEAARRVVRVGQDLAIANEWQKQGRMPIFQTIGAPQSALFHRGEKEIFITEGLVRRCKTDEQLAALLAVEMGRIVSEREALVNSVPEPLPPIDVPVGREVGGAFGPADGVRLAEMARFEQEQKRRKALAVPPDPQHLAGRFLARGGYKSGVLKEIQPLLRAAHQNVALERQIQRPTQ